MFWRNGENRKYKITSNMHKFCCGKKKCQCLLKNTVSKKGRDCGYACPDAIEIKGHEDGGK